MELSAKTISFLLIICFIYSLTSSDTLHPEEVNTLRDIAKKVGKTDWDFEKDPCSGQGNWFIRNDIELGINFSIKMFTLKEIKAATKNFRQENKIGEGGFGPVYKGVLSNGNIVAIKQLWSYSTQGSREFLTELSTISGLQHPNLVRLCGCCVEGKQLILVYEFMENNSLSDALFKKSPLKLDWTTRRKIFLGIAKGLAFIHEESTIKIIHRDIKTSNILLDGVVFG